MGDEDGGDAGRLQHARNRLAHIFAQAGIECRERFVEQHQPRLAAERAGERHTLLLAAGKLMRPPRQHAAVEFDHIEQLEDALLAIGCPSFEAEADIFGNA